MKPFLSSVQLRNYKSIGNCFVSLRPLTVLVGRNGAGKSNFLDALRFVVDALQSSLDHAIKSRGGVDCVRRRSTGHPRHFAIKLELHLPDETTATYAFEIGTRPQGGFVVKQEHLDVRRDGQIVASYRVEKGKVKQSNPREMPPAVADRLYLVNASGLPQFRGVYDGILAMGFYNMNPQAMKELQSPDAGELLHRDGANIASVIARLGRDNPAVKTRIKEYLAAIVPGITEVDRVALGPKESLEFRQGVVGAKHPWSFYALSMSDGTLRVLGALVAVTQLAGSNDSVTLVGIEEPETALHPAAAETLMEALRDAASHTQILITTHSPDLLAQINPDRDQLLVVTSEQSETSIAPVDPASRESIRKHLYDAGELLQLDQLEPDQDDLQRQRQHQFLLFDPDGENS